MDNGFKISELSGGIGLAGAVLLNNTQCCAQVQHGSAPDIAGKNIANPTSMILSVTMLFEWMADTGKLVLFLMRGIRC